MWEKKEEKLNAGKVIKYSITSNGHPLSFRSATELLKGAKAFRTFFSSILKENKFDAYFWEVKPMTIRTLEEDFEFVLVQSNTLENLVADKKAFIAHFQKETAVVDFPNLGHDARLIVPTEMAEEKIYNHLANFVRHAPALQLDEYWHRVGECYTAALGEEKIWLSTAGLGVSWLHVRLDRRPKYYRFAPYKI